MSSHKSSQNDSVIDGPRISVGILTVSDRCFNKTAEDLSGPNLKHLIEGGTLIEGRVVVESLVPDEIDSIRRILIEWCDEKNIDLIVTTGGTGVAPRDVTPEATKGVIEKEVPGMTLAMLQKSLEVTATAMLSRPVCGIRGRSLIINLPGSKKASEECLHFVAPCIHHASDLLHERSPCILKTHRAVQLGCAAKKHGEIAHHAHMSKKHPGCSGNHHEKSEHTSHRDGNKHIGDTPVVGCYHGNVSQRPRESLYPMLAMEEATNIVMHHACQTTTTETVQYHKALGRVLSQDVHCPAPFPPFRASIKDGYAVITADGCGERRIMSVSTAGVSPSMETLTSGFCARISTGAPVPNGADAVVQVEDTTLVSEEDDEEVEISILKAPALGQDIRPLGSDIAEGSVVLTKNTRLGASEMALLASVGALEVQCYRLPTVGILSTGDEVVEPDSSLADGKIRDSNKIALIATLMEQGFESIDLGIVKDNFQALVDELSSAHVDVVITTGGVSMGEKDFIKRALHTIGVQIHFGRIFMKPGKPTTFGTRDTQLFFCLPGNPVSAIVTCHLFVIPALRKMCGMSTPHNTIVSAQLQDDVKLDARPEYHRVLLDWSTAVPSAHSTGNQGSCRLVSMKSATALLQLPPSTHDKPLARKGDIYDAVIISRI